MELNRYHILTAITLLYLFALANILLLGVADVLLATIRIGALFGFISMFLATMTSNYLREVRQIFGRPFLKVHHWFAILGLFFITLHPVSFAILVADPLVFIPDFSSWYAFWSLAGRPALYIAYFAVLVALLRRRIGNYWRFFHALIYVVLTFAYIHGLLIGGNFANPIVALLFLAMLLLSFAVGVSKLMRRRGGKK